MHVFSNHLLHTVFLNLCVTRNHLSVWCIKTLQHMPSFSEPEYWSSCFLSTEKLSQFHSPHHTCCCAISVCFVFIVRVTVRLRTCRPTPFTHTCAYTFAITAIISTQRWWEDLNRKRRISRMNQILLPWIYPPPTFRSVPFPFKSRSCIRSGGGTTNPLHVWTTSHWMHKHVFIITILHISCIVFVPYFKSTQLHKWCSPNADKHSVKNTDINNGIIDNVWRRGVIIIMILKLFGCTLKLFISLSLSMKTSAKVFKSKLLSPRENIVLWFQCLNHSPSINGRWK